MLVSVVKQLRRLLILIVYLSELSLSSRYPKPCCTCLSHAKVVEILCYADSRRFVQFRII